MRVGRVDNLRGSRPHTTWVVKFLRARNKISDIH